MDAVRLASRRRLLRAVVAALALASITASPASAADRNVALQNNLFDPKSIAIKAGDTVIWTDKDVAPHSVSADDGSFDSHPDCSGPANCMKLNDVYKRQFPAAGTFPYYCRIHGGKGGSRMAGVVIVSAGEVATTTTTPRSSTSATRPSSATTRRAVVSPSPIGKTTTTTFPQASFPPVGASPSDGASLTNPAAAPIGVTTTIVGEASVVLNEDKAGVSRPVALITVAVGGLAAAGLGFGFVWRRSSYWPWPR